MKDKKTIAEMAEYLSDAITFTDIHGTVRSFRKFLWMGRFGVTDVKGERTIIPALSNNLHVLIDKKAEVILAGYELSGWSVYSLTGEKIKDLSSMSLEQAIQTIEGDAYDI